jgi:hypothetical protein
MAHWKTPTVILLAYLAALACAIGHHFFYASLDSQDVDNYYLGQEVTVAMGTAFAFLVRATLVIAVGTVYWQMFWLRLGRQSFAISELDSLDGALSSIFDLMDVRALRRSPELGIIAVLAWLLPFAAVFPPATISVHSALIESTERAHVAIPYLSGDAMTLWSKMGMVDASGIHYADRFEYFKASLGLTRLAMATATRGSILDSLALYSNSSYIISFEAPAVQCQDVASDIQAAITCQERNQMASTTESPSTPKRRHTKHIWNVTTCGSMSRGCQVQVPWYPSKQTPFTIAAYHWRMPLRMREIDRLPRHSLEVLKEALCLFTLRQEIWAGRKLQAHGARYAARYTVLLTLST